MEVKKLTLEQKLDVQYCVSNDVRDEKIRQNTRRIKGRVQAQYELRPEPIAVVNFGPSLNDTWEQIRDFNYIITCSGAHKFLVERGIIPTHHIDVDPRPHKAKLLGTPQPSAQYLIASTCDSALFDVLEGFDVKLWHIFDATDEGTRLLPHGEWAITGGCSAGLRCLTMARFLGFTNMHVFGMDGCESEKYGKHAAEHPNQPKGYAELEYEGRIYRTTAGMLEAAKQTFHELDMMQDVTVKFYGDGLVQAMAKNYERQERKGDVFVGYNKPELISADYARLNAEMHESHLHYGLGGRKHADVVKKLAKVVGKNLDRPASVLDYGCGKGMLAKALDFPIYEYDPAIPGKSESPRPADIVICTDVLEHVEPEKLKYVLGDLQRCVKQLGYFIIHTGPAQKCLPDGRNTHLIQKDIVWWKAKLKKYFNVAQIQKKGMELFVVVGPLPSAKRKLVIDASPAKAVTV